MLTSNLFWNIIALVSTILEWLVFRLIADKLSEKRKDDIIINISISIIILIIFLLTIMNINVNIKLVISISLGYIFYLYNYNYKTSKVLLLNLVYWMLIVALDFIGVNFVLILNEQIPIQELFSNNIFKLERILVSKLLLVSIVPIIKSLKYDIEVEKKEILHIIFPIIANILSVVAIFTLEMQCMIKSHTQKSILMIISSILILSNLSLIKIVVELIKSRNIKMENKIIREKIAMQYKHYLTIQESQIRVRKLYHDMNNHIICIEKLYGNNRDVRNYIESVRTELNCLESEISTKNMILDIIVNEKKNICDENNIDIEIDINFSKCNFIDMVDICSIFSNMLDNAIEACMKLNEDKRFIKLKGTIVNSMFVIKCENSKSNAITLKKGSILSDKSDSFVHGLGIKSIKSSVKKYDGEYGMDFSNDKFIMYIYIPLR